MASTKPKRMEVISLLDCDDEGEEGEGRTGAAHLVSRDKSAMTKGPTSMKPPPPKATRHRRLIKAEDSDDEDSDSDMGAQGLGKGKAEINLPTSRIPSEPASQDGRRRGDGAKSTSSLTAPHNDDVVDDNDSDAEERGPRRSWKPGLKRGTGPPSSTIVTKKPKKTSGKEGGPSSSILQFMKKAPGGAVSSSTGNGSTSGNGTGIGRKRPASQLLQPPPPPKTSQDLWIDKHRPKKAVDLSIPPQKVKQVRQWLTTALEQATNKLLILRGPPGVGKSTMAEVLAEEMGLDVLGWTEAAGVQAWRGEGDNDDRGSMGGSSQRGEFAIPYVSQADDFGTFLRGASYQPLVVTTSPSKKSLYQLSQEASSTRGRGRLFLIQELPSQVDHTSNTSGTYTQRALSTFQASLQTFLLHSVHPAVLIYTECESSGGETLLEKILSRAILHDPRVQQIQIRPTTDLKLRKVLERIAGEEGVRFIDTHEIEDLVASCNGDVRHAIMKLQFQYGHRRKVSFTSSQRSSSSSQSQSDGGGGEGTSRAKRSKDRFYSSLHAIGKVLNAKRDCSLPGLGDGRGRGPLTFDPEEALTRCEMEIDGLAVFLQTHCVPFFSQIEELVGAMDHFSDADLFISRLYSTSHMRDRSDPIFPEEYALSISSRGVADANIHPAPPAFRTFPTPRFWEVNRRRTDGVRRLSYLSNLYAQNAVKQEVGPGRMPSTTMVTEFIPFVKSIGERRQGGGNKSAPGGGDDPSLLGALEFLRLFNQTCCAGGRADAYRSLRDTQQHLLASSTAQEVMEVDDIVDE